MIVIAGLIVVVGAVLAGFVGSGGEIGALIHPFELVTIGGAALGAMIIMSSKKVLIDLVKGIIQALKGSPYGKPLYRETFMCLYDLFRVGRRDGMLALESHISDAHASTIFGKYPRVAKNHHVTQFICGALSPVIEGSAKPEQLAEMLDTEIKVIGEEHHAPLNVMSKTADALPGFGIVAAVLGIVITMGAISGPVEEVGHKVGSALVGTFLGILMSYGFFGPLASRMELLGACELAYFRTVADAVLRFVNGVPPKVALEQARRGVFSEFRPKREELEELFKQVDAS